MASTIESFLDRDQRISLEEAAKRLGISRVSLWRYAAGKGALGVKLRTVPVLSRKYTTEQFLVEFVRECNAATTKPRRPVVKGVRR